MMFSLSKKMLLFCCTLVFASCVKQSTYESALDEIAVLEQKQVGLQNVIQTKDQVISGLNQELRDMEIRANSNANKNSTKGQAELEFVKKSLNDIDYRIRNCESRDDLDRIQSDLQDVTRSVSQSLFFNY